VCEGWGGGGRRPPPPPGGGAPPPPPPPRQARALQLARLLQEVRVGRQEVLQRGLARACARKG